MDYFTGSLSCQELSQLGWTCNKLSMGICYYYLSLVLFSQRQSQYYSVTARSTRACKFSPLGPSTY